MQKQFFLFLVLGTVCLLMTTMVYAGLPPASVDTLNYRITCDILTVSWSHSSGTVSQLYVDSPSHVYYTEYSAGASGSVSIELNPALSMNEAFMIEVWIGDGTIASPGGLVASSQIFGHMTRDCRPESNEWVSVCEDGRLNSTCSPVAVYPVVSDDGVGWAIYQVPFDATAGELAIYLSAEDFAELPTEPENHCTIASSDDGRIVVYLLRTGQIQINMGPDEDFKTFVYVFNDLLGTPVQVYEYRGTGKPEILPACV